MDFTCVIELMDIDWHRSGTAIDWWNGGMLHVLLFNITNYWDWYAFEDIQKCCPSNKAAHAKFLDEFNALDYIKKASSDSILIYVFY